MRYISVLLLIAGLAINQGSYAQNYATDALRFSQYEFGSSARLKALGNAQTAVGGDISSIGGNPAGLGLFTRSELSLTTEVMRYSTESNYFNQTANASRGRLNLNNLGAVFVVKLAKPRGADLNSGVLSINFGLGYNKTNDLGNKLRFTGPNTQSSISDFYADIANSYTDALEEGSLEEAAELGELIYYNNTTNKYASANSSNRVQDEIIIRNGSQSELNLTTGINIGNKFYIGTSVGFLGINYSADNTFTETGVISHPNTTDNYTADYYQKFKAEGYGFNLKLGAIFRPTPYFRIGATAQSPNWYTIHDTYSESNNTVLRGNANFEDLRVQSQIQTYDLTYGLRTPAKFSLGAALFQSKLGFITGEVEMVDYSSMELESKDYSTPNEFVEDNRFIVNNYKNATNYRVGAEIKAASPFLLRAGYSFVQSPIQNADQNFDINTYTLGGGYRMGNVNIDIAYQSSSINSVINPYKLDSGLNPVATSKTTRNGIFITIGTRF